MSPIQLNPTLADFFERTVALDQAQRAYLIKNGVPVTALYRDGDGRCSLVDGCGMLGAAHAVVDEPLFDFAEPDDEGACKVLVAIARDLSGWAHDLVCWSPRSNRIASLGRAFVLGEHQVLAPRLSEAITVHRSFLSWLRSDRSGVVIVDPQRAWRVLEGVLLVAEDVSHGCELQRTLSAPVPRICVRRLDLLREAA